MCSHRAVHLNPIQFIISIFVCLCCNCKFWDKILDTKILRYQWLLLLNTCGGKLSEHPRFYIEAHMHNHRHCGSPPGTPIQSNQIIWRDSTLFPQHIRWVCEVLIRTDQIIIHPKCDFGCVSKFEYQIYDKIGFTSDVRHLKSQFVSWNHRKFDQNSKIQKIEKTAKPVVEYTCNNPYCIFYGNISPRRQSLGSARDLGTKRLENRPWNKIPTYNRTSSNLSSTIYSSTILSSQTFNWWRS